MIRPTRRQRSRTGFRPAAPERCESRELLSTLPIPITHRAHADVIRVDHELALRHHLAVIHEHPMLKIDSNVHPNAGGGPPSTALTPPEIRHIYSIDAISNLAPARRSPLSTPTTTRTSMLTPTPSTGSSRPQSAAQPRFIPRMGQARPG